MSKRRPLIAGNWKLNGSVESVTALARAIVAGSEGTTAELLVCPVALHLPAVRAVIDAAKAGDRLLLGAQNAASAASGAYTGEVSADMLAEYGCTHVIVGHSERRSLFGETSEQVAARAVAVQAAGLTPILCVGETQAEREDGQMQAVIREQLDAFLARVDAGEANLDKLVVAYEPVWAIGTGLTATPDQADEVHRFIRAHVANKSEAQAEQLQILYGGSVKPDNAAELFARDSIDGGLIGGAALDADSFLAIAQQTR